MSDRVLIAVTHLLGSGHLVRMRHLAGALARAGFEVTLASGGVPLRDQGAAPYALVQLPPVKIAGVDFSHLLDETGLPVTQGQRTARGAMLVELAQRLRPDVIVTEHFPFGRRQLATEFFELIAAAKAANPAVLTLSSIRDVLVAPRPERIVEAEQRLITHFDAVLVHGDAAFLPLEASWPASPGLAPLLRYTGYLTGPDAPAAAPFHDEIIVSGGGSAAALPLFEAALGAAGLCGAARRWRILVGRGVGAAEFASLLAAAPDHVTVEWSRPDFPALLAGCALSISQAGYNTVLDLVRAGRPALVVPFDEGNETGQAIRAQAMARAVKQALAAGPVPAAAIALDGAARAPGLVAGLLEARRRGLR